MHIFVSRTKVNKKIGKLLCVYMISDGKETARYVRTSVLLQVFARIFAPLHISISIENK